MVFSSLLFLFRFLPAILIAYYAAPHRLRNLILLLFSLIFYAWGEPVHIILMLISVFVSYRSGMAIHRLRQAGKAKEAKMVLILSITVSLLLLAVFKYMNFGIEAINHMVKTDIAPANLTLPIGISFYTFQMISYTIDVYRGEAAVEKNIVSFGTYVTMFPQLIAGPIVQYRTIAQQLRNRRESADQFAEGIRRFMVGLGKKVLLANQAGALWHTVQAMEYSSLPAATAWIGLIAYTFQIYFDFSAYSDMAIGLGHMFGFQFPENFNYPYISKSITEFWHRWHISLGTWFREYVYIPLGGNRVGKAKHIRNILIVWLLTGIWHGASWNFVIWGLYYGILLLAEKFVIGTYLKRLPAVFQHIYCMFFVILGWNLFFFDAISRQTAFLKSLFRIYSFGNRETIYLLYNHIVLLILCMLGCTRLPQQAGKWLWRKLNHRPFLLAAAENVFYIALFLLSTAWLVDASYNPFLYFRF